MKFDIVTQWVKAAMAQVPPDQSLVSRPVVKSAGKPGNGSPKPDGARPQAVLLSPEIVHMVVSG